MSDILPALLRSPASPIGHTTSRLEAELQQSELVLQTGRAEAVRGELTDAAVFLVSEVTRGHGDVTELVHLVK